MLLLLLLSLRWVGGEFFLLAFVEVETIQLFLFVVIVKNASDLKLLVVVVVRKFSLFASSSICVVEVVIGGNGEEDIIGDVIFVIIDWEDIGVVLHCWRVR